MYKWRWKEDTLLFQKSNILLIASYGFRVTFTSNHAAQHGAKLAACSKVTKPRGKKCSCCNKTSCAFFINWIQGNEHPMVPTENYTNWRNSPFVLTQKAMAHMHSKSYQTSLQVQHWAQLRPLSKRRTENLQTWGWCPKVCKPWCAGNQSYTCVGPKNVPLLTTNSFQEA